MLGSTQRKNYPRTNDQWYLMQTTLHQTFCVAFELPFNTTEVVVGSWLFCIHCFVTLHCMLGVGVEIRTKNLLYRFIEDQTHYGIPKGAKMSLTAEWTNIEYSLSNAPHQVHSCTKNSLNMESMGYKIPSSQIKTPSGWIEGQVYYIKMCSVASLSIRMVKLGVQIIAANLW